MDFNSILFLLHSNCVSLYDQGKSERAPHNRNVLHTCVYVGLFACILWLILNSFWAISTKEVYLKCDGNGQLWVCWFGKLHVEQAIFERKSALN